MPREKTKKKPAKLKKTAAKKSRPIEKAFRNKLAKKTVVSKKKTVVKTQATGKKKAGPRTKSVNRKRMPVEVRNFDSEAFTTRGRRSQPAGQSGDLQGLSNVRGADSESVDELIEEGNAFEAGVVSGVESAGNDEGKEVRTHEVPEDDVPGEYLDKD